MKRLVALVLLLVLGSTLVGRADGTPAPNDNRANAIEISAIPAATGYQGVTTVEGSEDTTCSGTNGTAWYDYRAADATPLRAYFTYQGDCGFFCSAGGTVNVFHKVRSQWVSVACGKDVTFTPEAAGHYFFQVTGFSIFRLNRAPDYRPFFDNFADRMNLVIPPFHYEEIFNDINSGTLEPGEPAACGTPASSFWYTFRGDTSRVIDLHVDNITPAYIVVYVRGIDGNLQAVPGTCKTLREQGFTDFPLSVAPGVQYYVQIGGNSHDFYFGGNAYFSICEQYTPGQNCFF
ncbi:MAG: hypothetical protein ABR548_04710 [Actinomycetota bacterium]|nr:hypothetical protein [Actinomycetota bacterium]